MKKQYSDIFPLLIASLLLAGCNFLDITPTGKVIPTSFKDFDELLISSYVSIPHDRGMASLRTDEYDLTYASSNDLNSYKDLWIWNDSNPDDATVSYNWRLYYNAIFVANHIIQSESKIEDGTPDKISQLVGEAYMIRAYNHFLLLNLFGEPYNSTTAATAKGIPLKIDNNMDELLSRSSVEAVYKQIFEDINNAERRMKVMSWPLGTNFRFSKPTIPFLRSRAHLYRGEWDKSFNASKELLILKDTLLNFTTTPGKMIPNRYDSPENILALELPLNAQLLNAVQPDKRFVDRYKTGDQRKNLYFTLLTASSYRINKGGDNTFKCSMRTAEIYLNAAEAACRMDQIEEARTYLDKLLTRRYNTSGWNTQKGLLDAMTTSEELLNYILEQRALELACEGHRWIDLRRTTRPEITKTFKGVTYTLSQNDARYTIPIPQEAKDSNPNLSN